MVILLLVNVGTMRDFRTIIKPADALVVRDAITAADADILVAAVDKYGQTLPKGVNRKRPYIDLTGTAYEKIGIELLLKASEYFDLPKPDKFDQTATSYLPGDRFQQHVDCYDGFPEMYSRVVSFSIMLSEPDVDFFGGEFAANGKLIPSGKGDAVIFNSMTPHSVGTITGGRRYVWINFGSYVG